MVFLVMLGGCVSVTPRYKLDMAYEKDRDDAVSLEKAQDQCRYTVERQAMHAGVRGASQIEVTLIGSLAEACMRSKGYKATRLKVVPEGT